MSAHKDNVNIFDAIKFILSLFVVQIHIGMFSTYSYAVDDILKNWIGRLAVPLFFMISSYLLFNKVDMSNLFSRDNIKIYKNYYKRLILLYINWGIIYFICLRNFYNINTIGFIFNFLFIGFYRQFWFLIAQIFGTFFLLILLRIFSLKVIILISIFLYIIGLILVPYNSIFVDLFSFISVYDGNVVLCRNFLTFGLLYISFGVYFSQNKNMLFSYKKNIFYLLLIIVFSLIEFIYLKKIGCSYYALQIFLPFIVIILFRLITTIKLKDKNCYLVLRKYSVLIFCLHTLVYLFLEKFLCFLSFSNNSLFMYVTTVLICILISKVIIFIDNKFIKLKFLY